jgi:hypothetical protein
MNTRKIISSSPTDPEIYPLKKIIPVIYQISLISGKSGIQTAPQTIQRMHANIQMFTDLLWFDDSIPETGTLVNRFNVVVMVRQQAIPGLWP